MTDKIRKILVAARKMIENEDDWYHGQNPKDRDLVCAQTSICRSGSIRDGAEATIAFAAAIEVTGKSASEVMPHIWKFNDTHSHAEVLAAFDRAIASTETI